MGKKATFGNNITLTPDECDTLKRYATNGILFHAENERLKGKLESAQKSASIWKQRCEEANKKYQELKQKAQPFLDAHGNCIRKGSGFYQFHPRQRKGNTGTQSTCVSVDRTWKFDGGNCLLKKYYEDAKYNAAFDRCVDVMSQMLQKYGHQVLDKLEQDAPQGVEHSEESNQAQLLTDKAA